MKKKKMKLKKPFKCLIFVFVILLVCGIGYYLFQLFDNPLIGSWVSSGGTVYQFNRNGKGVMIVPTSSYDYTYEIEGDKLTIDYVSDKANDAKYTYTIEKDKLTLKGDRGTFKFTKE